MPKDDLVARLRDWCERIRRKPEPIAHATPMVQEAADTIEALRAEVAALREALEKISKAKPDQLDHSIDVAIIQRAARIASAAIGRK